jgi:hypothetical protein
VEGDAVLGFRLSASHGSILPCHVQNRLPEHQSEQAHHCYGDCNLGRVFAWTPSISFLLEGMGKGYELGANHLCDAVHTSPLCRILQCDLRHKGLGPKAGRL